MSGCLEVAPEAFLRKRFSLIHRVLEAVGAATIICTLPLPRYVKRPCCNDEVHMTNCMGRGGFHRHPQERQ